MPFFVGDAPKISYIIVISPIKRWNIQTTGKKEGSFCVLAFQFVRPSNSSSKIKGREEEEENQFLLIFILVEFLFTLKFVVVWIERVTNWSGSRLVR